MIPFGNHTITLYHLKDEGYERHIVEGCSWRSSNTRSLIENSTVITQQTTCRLPADAKKPIPGDLLVLGTIREDVDGEIGLIRLMEQLRKDGYRAFRVQSCADNTGAPLGHYAATGA